MELDFSKKIQGFFETNSNPKTAAASFSEKISSFLEAKANKFNEFADNQITADQLKSVYRRGESAFLSVYRPGKTMGQFAMARVNKFLRETESSIKKDFLDKDIFDNSESYYVEDIEAAFGDYQDIELDLAKIDLIKAGISIENHDTHAEELEYTEAQKKTLNKPFRLKDGKKKYGVYVKNPKTGNIILVKFGDPNMEIKRDDPERRKNFRARHSCDTAKDKTTPRYWSCKFWSKKPVSELVSSEAMEWDDEEIISEWGWDETDFIEESEIFAQNEELRNVKYIVEEDDL